MLKSIRTGLTQPLAEDFSVPYQLRLSLISGVYALLVMLLLLESGPAEGRLFGLVASVAGSCIVVLLLANGLLPRWLPTLYNQNRWTVGRQALHVLFSLLWISVNNQVLLAARNYPITAFWVMLLTVLFTGFLPLMLVSLLAAKRRLKRNQAQAEIINQQLNQLHALPAEASESVMPESITLASEDGREQLGLLPNQLIYLQSDGNGIDVHYLNFLFPQQTTLRSTLDAAEKSLRNHPQFFRCHRYFIVNLKAISQAEGDMRGYQLTMSGSNREIPVSQPYLNEFDARMKTLV